MTGHILTAGDLPEDDELVFPPASEFVATMLELAEPQFDENNGSVTYLEAMSVELPVEMQIEETPEGAGVRMSAPTQRTLTSVYPVLHRIRFTLGATLT